MRAYAGELAQAQGLGLFLLMEA